MIELRLILTNTEGIPRIYYSNKVFQHSTLVMELLGPSLETLFDKCRRRFSVKTTAMIAIQLVSICTVYIRQAAF